MLKTIEIREEIRIKNEDLLNFLTMTPYYWQISEERKERLLKMDYLETPIHFYVKVYKKLNQL